MAQREGVAQGQVSIIRWLAIQTKNRSTKAAAISPGEPSSSVPARQVVESASALHLTWNQCPQVSILHTSLAVPPSHASLAPAASPPKAAGHSG